MILKHSDFVKQISDNKFWKQVFKTDRLNASGLTSSNNYSSIANAGFAPLTLPPSSNGWIMTTANIASSGIGSNILIAEVLDFGTLDLNTNVFTPGADAAGFGNKLQFGASSPHSGPVMAELTTAALNGSGNQVNLTYVDQDGNTAETGRNVVLSNGSVVGSAGLMTLSDPDQRVRRITGASKAAGTTTQGVLQFWGIKNAVMVPVASGTMLSQDLIVNHFALTKFPGGANIRLFSVAGNLAGALLGWLDLIEEMP